MIIKCTDCDYIKRDGEMYCLLNMQIVEDIDKRHDCGILERYNEFKEYGVDLI